jgi:glutamate synthase domain-containing protein 3
MGKPWSRTAEQDEYLQEQVKELLKARLDETVRSFRHQLYEKWEARWPEVKVLFPMRTDTDLSLTKEQIEELSKAMLVRKKVSLIAISVVTVIVMRFYP